MRIKQYTEVLPSGIQNFIYIDLDCIESVARYGRNPDQPNTIVMKSGRSINVKEPVRQILTDWENKKEKYLLTILFRGGAIIKASYDSMHDAIYAMDSVKNVNPDADTKITRTRK